MNMTIADRIKQKRIELGLSQTELATRAGYTDKTSISKFENAGNNVTMKQVKRLAKALNTTSSFLMGWSDGQDDNSNQEERAKRVLELYKSLPDEIIAQSDTLTEAIEIVNQYEELPADKKSQFLAYLKFLKSDV